MNATLAVWAVGLSFTFDPDGLTLSDTLSKFQLGTDWFEAVFAIGALDSDQFSSENLADEAHLTINWRGDIGQSQVNTSMPAAKFRLRSLEISNRSECKEKINEHF